MTYQVAKIAPTHAAIIDYLVSKQAALQPVSRGELAAHFGYSKVWISSLLSSDIFKEALAARNAEALTPVFVQDIQDQVGAFAEAVLQKLADKVEVMSVDQLLASAEYSAKAIGLGGFAPAKSGTSVSNNFVVPLPPQARSIDAWSAQFSPQTIEPHAVVSRVETSHV